jgi:hypothetical protein
MVSIADAANIPQGLPSSMLMRRDDSIIQGCDRSSPPLQQRIFILAPDLHDDRGCYLAYPNLVVRQAISKAFLSSSRPGRHAQRDHGYPTGHRG